MSTGEEALIAIGEPHERIQHMLVNYAWKDLCIYRVPRWLKDDPYSLLESGGEHAHSNTSAYTPEIVSLGPYYRGWPHLRGMEEHKRRILHHMLEREHQFMGEYLQEMCKLEHTARACYEGPLVAGLNNQEFLEMLVLDGCFLLEFLRGFELGFNYLGYDQYHDPVFSRDTVRHAIGRDMIRLENQIPRVILEKLLEIQYKGKVPRDEIPNLVLDALAPRTWVSSEVVSCMNMTPMDTKSTNRWKEKAKGMLHCLDIFRLSLLYEHGDPSSMDYNHPIENTELMVYCVADLKKAGVKLRSRIGCSFWEICFDEKQGILEIPSIKIDHSSKTVFLNLIAYEQRHFSNSWEMIITDYVTFMDNLINSAEDVGLLHKAGIIVHQLGSDAEVANLFNNLAKGVFLDKKEGGFYRLYKQLNKYCSQKIHRWRASFVENHLSDPSVITALFFASSLFLFTFFQTFYTILSYYNKASGLDLGHP